MRRVALLLALAVLAAAGAVGCDDGTGTEDRSGSACDPSYPDDCLDPDASDYDCEGGEGNGPEYVAGPVTVAGDDPFGLDRDGDGTGCDSFY